MKRPFLQLDSNTENKENVKRRKIITKKTEVHSEKVGSTPQRAEDAPKLPHPSSIRSLSPFTKKQCIFTESLINDLRRSTKNHLFELKSFPNVVCVEGNIGCGKSTLLKNCEMAGYTVLQEPVNQTWNKYLPLLYSDPKRWGTTFQLEVLHWFNKLRTLILPSLKNQIIVIERSPQSSFYIFCQNLFDSGLITEWEVSVIKRTYDAVAWKPGTTIYLQLEPVTCVERIKQRNRKAECDIDVSLIEDLHKRHEEIWANNQHEDIDVYMIDSRKPRDEVVKDALDYIKNNTEKNLNERLQREKLGTSSFKAEFKTEFKNSLAKLGSHGIHHATSSILASADNVSDNKDPESSI